MFLHGNPTSSYIWRNIIPSLSDGFRCIAPDLIGFGKSDKPDIEYSFEDHYHYFEGFVEKLRLKNITLVLHDWGSALGFYYALKNERNIKAIAFMEAFVKSLEWKDLTQKYRLALKLVRMPVLGWLSLQLMNGFVNIFMPMAALRKLSKSEKAAYRLPLRTIASRKPVRRFPEQIPIDGKPRETHTIFRDYSDWLRTSTIHKLLIYADPGLLINKNIQSWCRANIKNLETVRIGEGIHYLQEDKPEEIGMLLRRWAGKNFNR